MDTYLLFIFIVKRVKQRAILVVDIRYLDIQGPSKVSPESKWL